ncbi:hypothetical protein [Erythrobacter sp.]|jgi:hypothetical protein|uniref:hypothetical protein n=1 Tax=Erythrobacter sp. TaxID=1042 RepID=UPI002E99A5DE|nr:hypothetical protein [Erythrobacter sp.]
MSEKLPSRFYLVPLGIMAAAFLIGQGKEGAGVPIVILLSTMWVMYSVKHKSGKITNG